ncbi:alpha-galactosidase [Halanaerobium saccharolyticum]|uniref:Alpha-galactosidase n=1 Tax=Halanaerobium saccharolyticum TaxID=43595 RepID=A0A4R7YUR3_9FIRM|nr:alpha-glucosidase/alpha-galactosidase [Halanaerobium saccharolyticum]RAK06894.1 alpha-galactosidase [Halanaerobium saccharolyticum]TDW01504.1 alpha-galactosidase [Halanaerobium saccharolyticum]TDX52865.1 alpha-galactosidase [Halanaerobium saccharolyticum]
MKFLENKVNDINLAYIGGGSRGWAWNLMGDLALDEEISGTVSLYDIDHKAAADNKKIGNQLFKREEAKSDWTFEVSDSLKDVLKDTDFVIISILPGTFEEMESDVHAPEEYGIYQSVGDSVGPGGLVRALRTIPMYVEIAEAIKEFAPEAWVINYTNPMSLCTRTLYEIFPEIKAFGCCHEVFGTQELLAEMLYDLEGIKNIQRDEIKVNVKGINHFTWLDQAAYQDKDLFPLYEKFVDKYYETGFGEENEDYFSSQERVKFDLFKRYGLIAAAGDRHLAEFCPKNWYLKNPDQVEKWKFALTPVNWRKNDKAEKLEKSRALIKGEEEIELKASGEEGIRQIKAILGLEEFVTNVNLPNQGQIKGLPEGAVVETNALFSRNSVKPVTAGKLPDNIQALIERHVLNQETILKAALNKDKQLAFSAFINDPLVDIDLEQAEKLFNEMLKNTEEYLPGWEI